MITSLPARNRAAYSSAELCRTNGSRCRPEKNSPLSVHVYTPSVTFPPNVALSQRASLTVARRSSQLLLPRGFTANKTARTKYPVIASIYQPSIANSLWSPRVGPNSHRSTQNEKAARQQGSLFLRENSSNGGLVHRNFLRESYEPQKRGVKEILGIKYLCFQSVTKLMEPSTT